jgi:hypothetical protein
MKDYMKKLFLSIGKFFFCWARESMNPIALSIIIAGVTVSMYLAGNNPMFQMMAIALLLFTGVFTAFFLLFQAIAAIIVLSKPQK